MRGAEVLVYSPESTDPVEPLDIFVVPSKMQKTESKIARGSRSHCSFLQCEACGSSMR